MGVGFAGCGPEKPWHATEIMHSFFRIRQKESSDSLAVLLGCLEGRGEIMLVSRAGRSKRSLGCQIEVRLSMNLMPRGEGHTTKGKDKGIKKSLHE